MSRLDSSPTRLCCVLEWIEKCYPKISHDRSLCLRLLPSQLYRAFFWLVGFVFLFSILMSIGWFMVKLITETKNLINILCLWLFISDSLTTSYFLIMASADIALSPNFALYEAYWRSHTMCKLIKVFIFFSFMNFLFISLLISTVRMISVAFPFKASSIRPVYFYASSAVFAGYLCVSGAVGMAEMDVESELESRFCLGIIFPGTSDSRNMYKRLFFLILPCVLTYLPTEINQVVIVYSITASLERLEAGSVTRTTRQKIIIRCSVYLILFILTIAPFLTIQLLALVDVGISPRSKLILTLMTFLFPIMNNITHVYMTPSFTRCFSKMLSKL